MYTRNPGLLHVCSSGSGIRLCNIQAAKDSENAVVWITVYKIFEGGFGRRTLEPYK